MRRISLVRPLRIALPHVPQRDRGREQTAAVLPAEDALRWVDPAMAGEQVRDHGHDRDVRERVRTQHLHRHDRERERRVRGSAEDGGEPDARTERHRKAHPACEHAAERRADEEERRHLASEEADRERHGRQDELPGERGLGQRGIGEGAEDRRDAETEVGARPGQLPERDDRQPAERHPQRERRHPLLEDVLAAVGELHECDRRERHRAADHAELAEDHRVERHAREDRIRGVHDAEPLRDRITDDGGDEGRHERVVFHPSDADDLEPEDGARDRRAEHGAEAAGDPGAEHLTTRLTTDAEPMRDRVCEARPHLHRSPLAARAAAEEVRGECADEHHRRHPERDLGRALVDGVDDEVVAALDGLPPPLVEEPDDEPRDGQRVDEPLVRVPVRRHEVERQEEDRRRDPACDADDRAQRSPLGERPENTGCAVLHLSDTTAVRGGPAATRCGATPRRSALPRC